MYTNTYFKHHIYTLEKTNKNKSRLKLRQDVNADTSQIESVRRRLAFGKKKQNKKDWGLIL